MREYIVPTLILLCLSPAAAQTQSAPPPPPETSGIPAGWKLIKDAKAACQIAVPPEWTPFSDSAGAATFHDPGTAIAAVTSQPGQAYKPLTDSLLKLLDVRKEKVFENSAKRLFYQDRTSRNGEDPHAYSASVPGRNGMCSCHVVFLPSVTEEIARKIALSLGPTPE